METGTVGSDHLNLQDRSHPAPFSHPNTPPSPSLAHSCPQGSWLGVRLGTQGAIDVHSPA